MDATQVQAPETTPSRRARGEQLVTAYCRQAKLAPAHSEVILLHLCRGMAAPEIRRELERCEAEKADARQLTRLKPKRVSEVRALIESGLRRLCPLPGFREVLRQAVSPDQFQRFTSREEQPLTIEEAMRGPRPAQARTPFIGETWTEVCCLPGAPKRDEVPVRMAETVYRWW